MADPAVSVVIPTHQRRELVGRAVASVLAQDFDDLEAIVVDNGSTDGTREALAPLAGAGRIRYLWHEDRGPVGGRNRGIEEARGEVVAFLDSDDRWRPDHLDVVVAMLERHPEAVLATTASNWTVAGRDPVERARLVDPLADMWLGNGGGPPSATAVRRAALVEVGGFRPETAGREDIDLWRRLALLGPFCVLARVTTDFGTGPGSFADRTRRSGECLAALERSTEGVLADIRARRPGDAERLLEEGEGLLRFVAALRALDRGDRAAVATELAAACRALPRLSEVPGLVSYHLRAQLPRSHERTERARHFADAARAWPDPGAPTALHLRLVAVGSALRTGRAGDAARLLAGWPRGTARRALRVAAGTALHRVRRRRSRRLVRTA